jgi:hypothetical protein
VIITDQKKLKKRLAVIQSKERLEPARKKTKSE